LTLEPQPIEEKTLIFGMNFKKTIPYIVAVAVFVIVTLIVSRPLFSGKVLNQSDIKMFKGMSQEISDHREQFEEEPLWTNSMFGGMPAYQISVKYSGNLIRGINNFFHLYMPAQSGYIFMYFLGFYILLLCFKVNPWLALAGALAYGFSSYYFIILEVGHNSKANALGYAAPLLGGIVLLMRRKYYLGTAVTLLFLALQLNANHFQITYYTFMIAAFIMIGYLAKAIQDSKNTLGYILGGVGILAFFIAAYFNFIAALVVLLIFALALLILIKEVRTYSIGLALFIGSAVFAILPNTGLLLTTYEYGKYTIRGQSELTIDESLNPNVEQTSGVDKDYATQWSYGKSETFTLLIPNFKGGPSASIQDVDKGALKKVDRQMRENIGFASSYFGKQSYTAGPVYVGAIAVFLAFLALFVLKHPIKWALLGITLLAIALSWGKNYMGLSAYFLDYVPGYNKFRAVSMTLVIAQITIPLLAILGVNELLKLDLSTHRWKLPFVEKGMSFNAAFFTSFALIGSFCLMCFVSPTAFNEFTSESEELRLIGQLQQQGAAEQQISQFVPQYMENLELARTSIFQSDAIRSFAWILVAAVLLFLYARKIFTIVPILAAALGIVFLFDMWPVATRYFNADSFIAKRKFDNDPVKSAADNTILADNSLDFRVLSLSSNFFKEANTSYYHKSLGGYHGAKLKKYQELADFHILKESSMIGNGMNAGAMNDNALLQQVTSQTGVINMLNTKYFIVPMQGGSVAKQNVNANGNAWFVKSLTTVATADDEITGLYEIDTKTQAIIRESEMQRVIADANYSGTGSIQLTSYKANDLVYKTQSDAEQFAVFSEIYYPKGWNAYVDGELQPHASVNYVLRGIEIPAGTHTVEFKFEPQSYKTGNTIALIGSILVFLIVPFGFYMAYRKNEVELEDPF